MIQPDHTHNVLPPLPGLTGAIEQWTARALDEHAIVAITDVRGDIVYANDQFCHISGYHREELLGQNHRILKSGHHPNAFYADMWRTIATGGTWRGVVCNRSKSGQLYWVQSTIMPLLGTDDKPAYYLALRTDITELKLAEQANARLVSQLSSGTEELHSAQNQLAAFFVNSPIGISWREVTRDGRPGANHVNERFCELIGLTMDEALDIENVRRATHPDDWAAQETLTTEVYLGKRDRFSIDKRYIHKDGRVVWGNLTVAVLRAPDGHVTHHFAMLEDITGRRLAEEELRRSESRWRTYLSTASEILYALTPEHTYKFVSPAWTNKLGHPVEDVLGRSIYDFVHPEDAPRCREFVGRILGGQPDAGMVEYRMHHRDGRWIWHASTGSAYSDRDGRRAYFGVGRDISLRRQAQEELRAALARREELERIIDRSPSVVVLWRAEANSWPVEYVSASIRQFGYYPEQFTSRQLTFADITHPEDRERVAAELQAHAATGHDEYNQEYRIQCADGRVRWVDDHTIVRHAPDGHVTHHEGVITDITARKEAEENERAARERELNLAREVQQHLLPSVFPDLRRVEARALSQPSLHLGGDYFDVLEIDANHRGFVMADVSGKGAPAALMMAACRANLRAFAPGELSPAEVLRRVNRALQPDMPPRMFITLFYGILNMDTLELRYARAGHEAGLLIRAGGDGSVELLSKGGLALGLAPAALFDTIGEDTVALSSGDLLALYTDGINEACNITGEEFGRERLTGVLQRHAGEPLESLLRTIDRYLRQFCTLAQRDDDRALLLVRPR